MLHDKKKPKQRNLDGFIRAGSFVLISYLLLGLGRSLYKNYQFNNQLEEVRAPIKSLEEENANLRELAEFYKSRTFQLRQAREKLNLKQPDENVLILPDEPVIQVTPEGTPQSPASGQSAEPKKPEPNIIQWRHWFFG